jgi:hypothetical protein
VSNIVLTTKYLVVTKLQSDEFRGSPYKVSELIQKEIESPPKNTSSFDRMTPIILKLGVDEHRSYLVNLPIGLLRLVLQQIDRDHLLQLAGVCSLFYTITLSLFFDDIGFSPESPELPSLTVGGDGHPFALLKAIRLSFTIKHLHHLHCQFCKPTLIEDMEEVRRLIGMLTVVESVSILYRGRSHQMSWMDEDDDTWIEYPARALVALLSALDGKSCTHLKLAGLYVPPYDNTDRTSSLCFKETFSALNTLQDITIDTRSTLFGELWGWLVETFDKSPIHTLKLTTHSTLDHTPLHILKLCKLPHLTDVHLHGSIDDYAKYLPVLKSHPALTSLHTTMTNLGRMWGIQKLGVSVPSLTKLAARPKFVADLLSFPLVSPPGPASALTAVHLFTADWSDEQDYQSQYFKFNDIDMTEALTVISTCPTIRRLSFTMHRPPEMDNWMTPFAGRQTRHHMKSSLALPYIIHLTVFMASRIQPIFLQWLKLFPDLMSLVLDDAPAYCGRTQFVGQLRERFPGLLEVAFSKDASPRPIAEWLIEDD